MLKSSALGLLLGSLLVSFWVSTAFAGKLLPLRAGEFELSVPARCAVNVKVSQKPATPLYTPEYLAETKAELAAAKAERGLSGAPIPPPSSYMLKPSFDNMPAHTMVDLQACFPSTREFDAEIRIIPVRAYFGIYSEDQSPSEYVKQQFDRFDRYLTTHGKSESWLYIPYIDAGPTAIIGATFLQSPDFNGVRVITDFSQDSTAFLTKESTSYIYQALSKDRQHFIVFSVAIIHSQLADYRDMKHLGVLIGAGNPDPEATQTFIHRYQLSASDWYARNATQIHPKLSELDAIARSIQLRN